MRRLLAVAVFAFVFAAIGMVPAHAAEVATTIVVDHATVTVNGQPVELHVRVRDAAGRPVSGALVRLFVPVEFMGATKNEIVGEGTTNDAGRAVIRFAPAQTGQVEGTLAFWGSTGYAASETTVSFDIQQRGIHLRPHHGGPAGVVGAKLPDPRPVRRGVVRLPVAPLARGAGQEGGRSGVSAIRYRRNELKEER